MKHTKVGISAILSLLIVASMILMPAQSALAYTVSGDSGGAVHERLVGYAMDVYQGANTNYEMLSYLATIQDGARHEDRIDIVDDVLWGDEAICLTQSHFWDGDLGPNDPVDNVAACGFEVKNSWKKAQILWGMALGEYREGDLESAYHYLGHVAHLLADQSVPTHAHKDAHPATEGGDIYEDWMTDDPQRAQLTPDEMLMLMQEGPVQILERTSEESYGPYAHNNPIGPLYYLFYTMNQIGDYFPSDDDFGSGDGDAGWIGGSHIREIHPVL